MSKDLKLAPLSVTSLNKAELVQLVTRFLDDLAKSGLVTNTDPIMTKLLSELRKNLPALQKILVQVRGSQTTALIATADRARDDDLKALMASVKPYRTSKREAQKEAYRSLSLLLNTVKTAHKASYEEETALVNGLLAKLGAEPYQAQVRTLGLQGFVDNLSDSNTAFNTLFANRSQEELTKVSYDSKALKKAVSQPYSDLVAYVDILARVKGDKPSKDLLQVINNSRRYYAEQLKKQ